MSLRTRPPLRLKGGPGCWGPVRSTREPELGLVRSRAALSLVPYRKPVPRYSPPRFTYLSIRDCVPRNPDLILAYGWTSRSRLTASVMPSKGLIATEAAGPHGCTPKHLPKVVCRFDRGTRESVTLTSPPACDRHGMGYSAPQLSRFFIPFMQHIISISAGLSIQVKVDCLCQKPKNAWSGLRAQRSPLLLEGERKPHFKT